MSNTGKFKDPIPQIKPVIDFYSQAGKQTTLENENADNCIRQDLHFQVSSFDSYSLPRLQNM